MKAKLCQQLPNILQTKKYLLPQEKQFGLRQQLKVFWLMKNIKEMHFCRSAIDWFSDQKTKKEFNDFGECYDKVHNVKRDEEINFIIVFKVDKKYGKNGFVLYYQEKDGYLRRIKLKLNDVRKVCQSLGERKGWIHRTHRIFRAVKILLWYYNYGHMYIYPSQ